jgi:hypothetical protein
LFLLFPQGYTGLETTVEAGYYYMRLSSLPYPHPAIIPLHEQHMAVFADLALVHCWEGYSRSHSYFSGNCDVASGKLRIIAVDAFSLLKENLDAVSGYLFYSRPHVHVTLLQHATFKLQPLYS